MEESGNAVHNGADGSTTHNVSNYTIEGVIHFLQMELLKIENQRAKWELEKTELQAQLAFFQGERQGQEMLKKDLVRRIKMLEFALKQERIRNQQLKGSLNSSGVENMPLQKISLNKPSDHNNLNNNPAKKLNSENTKTIEYNTKWRNSRERLLQILNEIKCTDSYLDKSQPRLKQLFLNSLGSGQESYEEGALRSLDFLNEDFTKNPDLLKNFNQLTSASGKIGSKAGKNSELNDLIEMLAMRVDELNKNRNGDETDSAAGANIRKSDDNQSPKNTGPKESELQLQTPAKNGLDQMNNLELGDLYRIAVNDANDANDEKSLNGEVNVDSYTSLSDVKKEPPSEEDHQSSLKYKCKGHYQSVRSLAYLHDDVHLVSGSDDGSIILWNLTTDALNETKSFMHEFLHQDHDPMVYQNEVEPSFIFRGHLGPVLKLVAVPKAEVNEDSGDSKEQVLEDNSVVFLSSGLDGTVRSWNFPNIPKDEESSQIDSNEYGPVYSDETKEPIWAMDVHPTKRIFVTASSTARVNFWALGVDPKSALAASIDIDKIAKENGLENVGRATCIKFIPDFYMSTNNPNKNTYAILTTSLGYIILVNMKHASVINLIKPLKLIEESGKRRGILPEFWSDAGIHSFAFQSPIAITNLALCYEDGQLRFFNLSKVIDLMSDECFKEIGPIEDYISEKMVLFMGAITDIDVDSAGLNMVITGDRDWFKLFNFNKTLSERKTNFEKNQVNVCIALHRNRPFLAIGLSNGTVNIYTHENNMSVY